MAQETKKKDYWRFTEVLILQAVRMATQCAPAHCTPDTAAQLQPIPYACGTQRALLPVAVDAMNINELVNINYVRESATIFAHPCKLTFDL